VPLREQRRNPLERPPPRRPPTQAPRRYEEINLLSIEVTPLRHDHPHPV